MEANKNKPKLKHNTRNTTFAATLLGSRYLYMRAGYLYMKASYVYIWHVPHVVVVQEY